MRANSLSVGPCNVKPVGSTGFLRGTGSGCAPGWNDGIPQSGHQSRGPQNDDWIRSSKPCARPGRSGFRKVHQVARHRGGLGELDPSECVSACLVSTWKPSTRHSYTSHLQRFARMGGTCPWDQSQSLTEKVLLSMCASPYQAGSLRGCVSALKAVVQLGWAPEVQWPRLWRLAKAPQQTPCHRPYSGPKVLQLLRERCKTAGDWKVYAGAVLSFSTLARVAKIASTCKSNITKMGLTFQELIHGDREVARCLGSYALAWSAWLRKLAPGEALTLGSSSALQEGMSRLLQGTPRHDARWHAWRRAGATYLRALGLLW